MKAGDLDRTRTRATAVSVAGQARVLVVREATIDRALSSDAPEAAQLTGGTSAAEAKLAVDAAMPGAPSALVPADRDAWLGAPALIRTGFGSIHDVFSGRVREIGTDDAARTTDVTLVDASDQMRATVTLPAFGSVAAHHAPRTVHRFPTNASAVVVAALHACGIRVTPRPAADVVLHMPMVFGPLPDPGAGWTVPGGWGVAAGGPLLGSDGPFGPRVATDGYMAVRGFPNRRVMWGEGTATVALDFWGEMPARTTDEDVDIVMEFSGYSTRLVFKASVRQLVGYVKVKAAAEVQKFQVGMQPGWHHVRITVNRTSNTGVLWVDGQTTTSTNLGVTAPGTDTILQVGIGLPSRMQAVTLLASAGDTLSPPIDWGAFKAQADVSVSALELDSLPEIDQAVAWELVKEVAAAEFGHAGFNESGRFQYRSRAEVNGLGSGSVLTVTGDVAENIRGSAIVDAVRTQVETARTPTWLVDAGRGAETKATTAVPTVWADDALRVPPGWSAHRLIGSRPWQPRSASTSILTQPGHAWEADTGVALNASSTGGGRVYSYADGFMAQIVMLSPTVAEVWIKNPLSTPVTAVWPTAWNEASVGDLVDGGTPGGPGILVNGRDSFADPVTIRATVDAKPEQARWGVRPLVLEESPWRQTAPSVSALASRLLGDLKSPRVQLDDITIPGDPRLELGDLITLSGQDRWPSTLARVVRIQHRIGRHVPDQGHQMTLGLVAVAGLPVITQGLRVSNPFLSSIAGASRLYDHLSAVAQGATATRWEVSSDREVWVTVPGATTGTWDGSGLEKTSVPWADSPPPSVWVRVAFSNSVGTVFTEPAELIGYDTD